MAEFFFESYQNAASLQHVRSVENCFLVIVMLECDDQRRPAANLRPQQSVRNATFISYILGGSQSEYVDQHDLPPDPQPGPHDVGDDVGEGLHHLSVLDWQAVDENVVPPVPSHLLHLRVHLEHLGRYYIQINFLISIKHKIIFLFMI